MIYLNFDTSWICDTFKLNMLQLKHMKYPSNNKSLYSRKAPESCTWWKRFCAWACLESSDAHSTQENSLNSPHTFWSNEHTLCLNILCQAHLIRRVVHICVQAKALHTAYVKWRGGKRPIWESTSQPLAHERLPFHTIVLCLLVFASTFYRFHLFRGKYLWHRQKLPFLPPSFLVNPWPLL